VRDDGWKLNEKGELYSMKDAPFVEAFVSSDTTDTTAQAARKRLGAVLAELNPAGGKTVPPDAEKAKNKAAKQAKRQAKQAAAAKK